MSRDGAQEIAKDRKVEEKMKGYKAFENGLVCKGKQYAEHTVFEEPQAKICKSGMHFCENPLDTLDYYPLIGPDGKLTEFADVEALADTNSDDGKKFCTTKLKVGAKFSVWELGKISAEVLREKITKEAESRIGVYYAQQVGGYSAQQVGGTYAQQVGGYSAQQVGGDRAQQVGGDRAQQVGGYYAQQVGVYRAQQVGDDYAQQVGGTYAKQVGGYYAQQVGGAYAQQVGGYYAQQVGGTYAQQVGGAYAQQVGGDRAQQVGDDYAQQVGGYSAQQVGGASAQQVGGAYAKQQAGKNSIMVSGKGGKYRAGMHSVIVGVWYDDAGNIAGFKAAQIDGEKLKPDTWYTIEDGEFTEVGE